MKPILKFIKTTITGGVLFLLPVMVLVILVGKAFRIVRPLLQRGIERLHIESLIGVTLLTILTAFFLCITCFISGLLIRLDRVKRIRKSMEDLILRLIPGYEYLKDVAEERISGDTRSTWNAVILKDGDAWVIAFLVEQSDNGYTTVFIPESPRGDSGNSKVVLTSSLCYQSLSRRQAFNCIRHYGAGVTSYLKTNAS
jgi:uncharacterized membrane protein